MSRFITIALCLGALVAALAAPVGSKPPAAPIVVDTTNELKAALVGANAGRTVIVRAGTYQIDAPLTVPDGMALEGEGVMLGAALPTGFQAGTETRILALPGLTGDMLKLRDGASIRRLIVQDVAGRAGNVVAVLSRAAGDSVSASIVECEIINPNNAAGNPDGPTGGGIVALTGNPDFGNPLRGGPHVGANVDVHVTRTIVRAAGRAFFAMNFATRGRIGLVLSQNLVAGTLEAFGGISRPDEVVQAVTTIQSDANLYDANLDAQVDAPRIGWLLVGGGAPPFPLGDKPTSSNTVRIVSNHDRIEARVGILAIAGRRSDTIAGPSSDNAAVLKLRTLAIRTSGDGAADLQLWAALAFDEFVPGNGNTLSVDMSDSTGSGPRFNEYADVVGPVLTENFGVGNRLKLNGNPGQFAASNTGFEPAPPAEFFTSAGH